MTLLGLTKQELIDYVVTQIHHFIPDGKANASREQIAIHADEAIFRTMKCINGVKFWKENEFNYLHSSQYCIFLYYLGNTIWKNDADAGTPLRLFLLNKALNGIDLFYEISMPDIFFIGHSVGIVLAKATYGEYLVLYQNATVGKSDGIAPVIEERVIIHPSCAVIGRSRVASGSILSQGVSVINRDTVPDNVVYSGNNGSLIFRKPKRDIITDFFRL